MVLLDLSGLVSWGFLGDALRRIWISFKSTRGLLRNEKVMLLHMVIFTVYIVSAFLKIAEMKIYFSHENTKSYNRSLVYYTISEWCLFFDELILCYLFIVFSAPAVKIKIDEETGGLFLDKDSTEIESSFSCYDK